MMKMNFQKRCFLLVLCAFLLLPLLSLGVAATADPADVDEEGHVIWVLSENGNTLMGNGKTYKSYQFPVGSPTIYGEAMQLYVYWNSVECAWLDGAEGTVYAPYPGSDLVLVRAMGMGEWYLYTTELGKAQMDAFASGQLKNYFLRIGAHLSTELDSSIFNAIGYALQQTDNKRTEDVANLQKAHRFDVIVYDATLTYAYTVGAVYRLEDGKDYYVHYLSLENHYFDADGNFSYRSGSVELTALDSKISTELDEVSQGISGKGTTFYIYEDDGSDTQLFSETTFWVLYSLMGFVAPVPLFVVGLVLPYSKKRGYPKYWRVLSVIAAIWIILAAILMIVLM